MSAFSISRVTTVTPPNVLLILIISSIFPSAFFSFSFVRVFSFSFSWAALSVFSCLAFSSFIHVSAALPVTASILRIPEATEPSRVILNISISFVLSTCVPPHISFETSPACTTFTLSPYFSPKSAVAPPDLASERLVSVFFMLTPFFMQSFTKLSIFSISRSESFFICVKSNLKRSCATSDPAW